MNLETFNVAQDLPQILAMLLKINPELEQRLSILTPNVKNAAQD